MECEFDICNRGYVEIDLDAIAFNMEHMKANLKPGTKMIGVIKTNGYGHGSIQIAKVLEPMDFVFGYAVATFEEALDLRNAGLKKPILILGYTFPYAYQKMAELDIRPAVFREDSIVPLAEAARKAGKKIKVHVKVDTGMSRIGIRPNEEGIKFLEKLMREEWIEIEGIFTHFARADEADKTGARRQLEVFTSFLNRIQKELGLDIPVKHCSNSAGIWELPEANLDVVRAGITLYGLYPSEEVSKDVVPLKPVMSLYSCIVYCKEIDAGTEVSYGGTFVAPKDMRIATIPLGYGDGYPRSLSGKGYVLVRGKKAPILGRVCMDQFMVDVTDIPDAKEGDLVTLLGKDGDEAITAEMLGTLSGRFNYELVCDISRRVPRVYKWKGAILDEQM